ncbi:MAG: nicotinate-nucleotide adenylyltransferase [Thermoanaerobaculia bacterium]
MRIGICGGTFDPFHRGHLDPILAVRDEMQWDRVLYIPAHVQPFKTDRETASPFHRHAMTILGTQSNDALFVSARELERGTVSYTVDTLRELRAEHPEATLDWIIGDDNLSRLHEWKSIETIASLANFTVLTRNGYTDFTLSNFEIRNPRERQKSGSIVFARNATVPISSTDIRKRLQHGESIEELVPPAVSRYIHHYGLYRKGHS